jgi:hemerythrin superfamily protein
MIREKFLIQLSKEHHDFLILAQLLKKDIPDYKGLPNNLDDKILYAQDKFNSKIKSHFSLEQKIFDYLKDVDHIYTGLCSEYESDHNIIERMLLNLNPNLSDSEDLNEAGIKIYDHTRKEERLLFQQLQSTLTETQKKEIEKIIDNSKTEEEKDS